MVLHLSFYIFVGYYTLTEYLTCSGLLCSRMIINQSLIQEKFERCEIYKMFICELSVWSIEIINNTRGAV